MSRIDDSCGRLARRTARLNGEIEARLASVRRILEAGDPAEAALELEGVLRHLDDVNEAAGECLAALQDADLARARPG